MVAVKRESDLLGAMHLWLDYIQAPRSGIPEGPAALQVVQGDDNALEWAIPRIQKYAEQLRHRFDGLSIVVVSHGREQFGLLKSSETSNKAVHEKVESLVKNDDIAVHVCGTYASWFDKVPEDFVEFVDVAATGPAQINDYVSMGYELITLHKPR